MTYIAQRLLMFQRYSLFFFISILYTLSLEVYSQSVCPTKHPLDVDGQFKISTLNNTIDNRFCVGAPITILDPPNNTNIAVTGYIFEYQDPAIPYKDYEKKYPAKIAKSANGSATYTYTKPGKYCIIQIGSNNTASFAAKEIEIVGKAKPVVSSQICSNNSISVTFPKDSSNTYDWYYIIWGDTSGDTQMKKDINFTDYPFSNSHAYQDTTLKYIRITGGYDVIGITTPIACINTRSIPVKFTNNTPFATPEVSLLEVNGGKLSLSFSKNETQDYEILYREGSSTTFKSFSPAIKYTAIPNGNDTLKTAKVVLPVNLQVSNCFKVVTTNVCGVSKDSDEICQVPFKVDAQTTGNLLSWSPYPLSGQLKQYNFLKNQRPYKGINNISATSDLDNNLVCGVEYTYQMKIDLNLSTGKSAQFISDEVRVTSKFSPKLRPIDSLYVDAQGGKVYLSWIRVDENYKKYTIYRGNSSTGSFTPLQTTVSEKFEDATANINAQSYCYKVSYTDNCDHESDLSAAFCTLFLSTNGNNLIWNAINFPDGIKSYIVEELDENGNPTSPLTLTNVGNVTSHTPDLLSTTKANFSFRIIAQSANGLHRSYSNIVTFNQLPQLFIPTAFTPNGDKENETFNVRGTLIKKLSLQIFDRWGSPVFETTDPNAGWDGTVDGQRASVGSYSYRAEVEDSTGTVHIRVGSLMLIR